MSNSKQLKTYKMTTITFNEAIEKAISYFQTAFLIAAIPVLFVLGLQHGGSKIGEKATFTRSIEKNTAADGKVTVNISEVSARG
jgi:hypothetical protein